MNKNSLNETINKINRIDISIKKKLNESETKKCLTKKRIALIKKTIFILNIALLFANIVLLIIYIQKNKNAYLIYFNDSYYFNMNLFKKTYQYISTYLLNKYNTINNHMSNFNDKKVIKIKAVGLYDKNNNFKWLKERLSNKFILEYDSPNPDYLLYNVFSDEHLKSEYHNIIRIAVYTENTIPDLDCADYFIAHPHINYLDRYFKMNIFLWENFNEIKSKRLEILNNPIRKKFCAGVISKCEHKFRLNFINKLNNYKKVDMGGRCYNNMNGRVIDKIKFFNEYKFSIAMENSEGDGYISEKIVDSFRGGTIPIYYGDYLVDEYINPKTYILIRGEKDIEKKIEYIKKIDNDDKLYMEIMKENPIIDEKFAEKIDKKEIKEFLYNIFSQNKNKAFRRDESFFDFNPDLICR